MNTERKVLWTPNSDNDDFLDRCNSIKGYFLLYSRVNFFGISTCIFKITEEFTLKEIIDMLTTKYTEVYLNESNTLIIDNSNGDRLSTQVFEVYLITQNAIKRSERKGRNSISENLYLAFEGKLRGNNPDSFIQKNTENIGEKFSRIKESKMVKQIKESIEGYDTEDILVWGNNFANVDYKEYVKDLSYSMDRNYDLEYDYDTIKEFWLEEQDEIYKLEFEKKFRQIEGTFLVMYNTDGTGGVDATIYSDTSLDEIIIVAKDEISSGANGLDEFTIYLDKSDNYTLTIQAEYSHGGANQITKIYQIDPSSIDNLVNNNDIDSLYDTDVINLSYNQVNVYDIEDELNIKTINVGKEIAKKLGRVKESRRTLRKNTLGKKRVHEKRLKEYKDEDKIIYTEDFWGIIDTDDYLDDVNSELEDGEELYTEDTIYDYFLEEQEENLYQELENTKVGSKRGYYIVFKDLSNTKDNDFFITRNETLSNVVEDLIDDYHKSSAKDVTLYLDKSEGYTLTLEAPLYAPYTIYQIKPEVAEDILTDKESKFGSYERYNHASTYVFDDIDDEILKDSYNFIAENTINVGKLLARELGLTEKKLSRERVHEKRLKEFTNISKESIVLYDDTNIPDDVDVYDFYNQEMDSLISALENKKTDVRGHYVALQGITRWNRSGGGYEYEENTYPSIFVINILRSGYDSVKAYLDAENNYALTVDGYHHDGSTHNVIYRVRPELEDELWENDEEYVEEYIATMIENGNVDKLIKNDLINIGKAIKKGFTESRNSRKTSSRKLKESYSYVSLINELGCKSKTKIGYPYNKTYNFAIGGDNDIYQVLDSEGHVKAEFSLSDVINIKKEEDGYVINLNSGSITLKKDEITKVLNKDAEEKLKNLEDKLGIKPKNDIYPIEGNNKK